MDRSSKSFNKYSFDVLLTYGTISCRGTANRVGEKIGIIGGQGVFIP